MTYNPWLDAAQRYPQVHIEWHPLRGAHACWVPDFDVILVDERITRAERRCALAHELAHLDVGDRPTRLCWFASRQETAADQLAARRLVDIGELLDVLRWATHPSEVAEALEVTVPVLQVRGALLHPAERAAITRVLDRRDVAA